jgi:hypothetical protein
MNNRHSSFALATFRMAMKIGIALAIFGTAVGAAAAAMLAIAGAPLPSAAYLGFTLKVIGFGLSAAPAWTIIVAGVVLYLSAAVVRSVLASVALKPPHRGR